MSSLVGIARLAAQADRLESKREVEYFLLPVRTFINRCLRGSRMPFAWTLNPYRGCEFGCVYCYARYTHEFMELREPAQFEDRIFAKQWNEQAFRRELRRIPRREEIAIGTATDPYQPAERRFGITREILRVFAGETGRHVSITTKSDLVPRDLDLLLAIASRNRLWVNFTITTLDAELARMLEPRAPRPDLRLAAAAKLAAAGIGSSVFCCPILPLINDGEEQLDALAASAARAGVDQLHGHVVYLKAAALQVFLPFLEERFPHLARRYRERFEQSAFLRGDYPRKIAARMAAVRRRHSLDGPKRTGPPAYWMLEPQMDLFTPQSTC